MEIWVRSIPYRKELVTFCLERGISTFWVDGAEAGRLKKLGRVTAVCEGGDLVPGVDFDILTVEKREDLEKLYDVSPERRVFLDVSRKDVIPLENLVAYGKRVFVPVRDEEDALVFSGVLEKGVAGVVLVCEDIERAGKILMVLAGDEMQFSLSSVEITEVKVLGMGDRVCVDTCSIIEGPSGMLVGNSSRGFFLVSAENVPSEYVNPRPFRVNAGAVHMYTLLPGGKTSYLSELSSGDSVLVVDHEGRGFVAWVGRAKVEKRPMLLITGTGGGVVVSAILQNAETIRLITEGGEQVSIADIKPGDRVLGYIDEGARHFGVKIEEKIAEK